MTSGQIIMNKQFFGFLEEQNKNRYDSSQYTLYKQSIYNFYNYMSDLLDLAIAMQKEQKQASNPQNVKNIIKGIFKSKIFPCRNIVDSGTSIIFFLDASKNTYQRSTIWSFDLSSLNFTISISFYNFSNEDLLRAYTERMKIQSSILIRLINLTIFPSFCYVIDRQSGTLKFNYSCSWQQFIRLSNKMQMIIKLINRIFMNMRLYHQLTIFIQPQCYQNISYPQQKNPHIIVNHFRILLQKTLNYNNAIRGLIGDILKMKHMNDQKVLQNLIVVENLYLNNVIAYQQSMMGLQKIKQSFIDQKLFQAEQIQIKKHQMGITTNTKANSINQKIVFGLYQIKQTTPKDESKKQQQWVKLPEQEGAHSSITKKFFKYIVVQTIYKGSSNQNKDIKYPQQRNYLICKDCKKDNQTSKNSFRNQLKAIQYMKDKKSPFIARYYLKLRQKWDQSDTIYMKCYQKNLFTLINEKIKDRVDCLTVRKKIDISYKIAKGLCFLYSNKMTHRDFKPQNIVLDSKSVPKIIDFGSCASHYDSKLFKPYNQLLLTTRVWNCGLIQNQFSKEKKIMLRSKFVKTEHYNQHPLFDVYAFGKILCFIFFYNVKTPNPELFLNDPHYQVLSHIIFLIQLCINPDPDDRPGLGQLTAFLGSLRKLLQFDFAQNQNQQQQKEKQ